MVAQLDARTIYVITEENRDETSLVWIASPDLNVEIEVYW